MERTFWFPGEKGAFWLPKNVPAGSLPELSNTHLSFRSP